MSRHEHGTEYVRCLTPLLPQPDEGMRLCEHDNRQLGLKWVLATKGWPNSRLRLTFSFLELTHSSVTLNRHLEQSSNHLAYPNCTSSNFRRMDNHSNTVVSSVCSVSPSVSFVLKRTRVQRGGYSTSLMLFSHIPVSHTTARIAFTDKKLYLTNSMEQSSSSEDDSQSAAQEVIRLS